MVKFHQQPKVVLDFLAFYLLNLKERIWFSAHDTLRITSLRNRVPSTRETVMAPAIPQTMYAWRKHRGNNDPVSRSNHFRPVLALTGYQRSGRRSRFLQHHQRDSCAKCWLPAVGRHWLDIQSACSWNKRARPLLQPSRGNGFVRLFSMTWVRLCRR
jgi:hypothetical protein